MFIENPLNDITFVILITALVLKNKLFYAIIKDNHVS